MRRFFTDAMFLKYIVDDAVGLWRKLFKQRNV